MKFIYYTVIQIISGFFYALGGTPSYMIMFRLVKPTVHQRLGFTMRSKACLALSLSHMENILFQHSTFSSISSVTSCMFVVVDIKPYFSTVFKLDQVCWLPTAAHPLFLFGYCDCMDFENVIVRVSECEVAQQAVLIRCMEIQDS